MTRRHLLRAIERALYFLNDRALVTALLLFCALLITVGVYLVTDRHRMLRLADEQCAEAQRVLMVQRPILRHVVEAESACLTLARMRGREP